MGTFRQDLAKQFRDIGNSIKTGDLHAAKDALLWPNGKKVPPSDYEVITLKYNPGKKRGPHSSAEFNDLIAAGWDLVANDRASAFSANFVATFRRRHNRED